MKLGPCLRLLPLVVLPACAEVRDAMPRVPTLGEVASILPGQGPANFPGTRDGYVMVDPGADCRRTLGDTECTLYVAPPGRSVPLTPVPPGAAQIHPGNGGGDGRVPTFPPIPTGTFLTPDGRLIPMTPEVAQAGTVSAAAAKVSTVAQPVVVSPAPALAAPAAPASKPAKPSKMVAPSAPKAKASPAKVPAAPPAKAEGTPLPASAPSKPANAPAAKPADAKTAPSPVVPAAATAPATAPTPLSPALAP
jgi:hypothetical protein